MRRQTPTRTATCETIIPRHWPTTLKSQGRWKQDISRARQQDGDAVNCRSNPLCLFLFRCFDSHLTKKIEGPDLDKTIHKTQNIKYTPKRALISVWVSLFMVVLRVRMLLLLCLILSKWRGQYRFFLCHWVFLKQSKCKNKEKLTIGAKKKDIHACSLCSDPSRLSKPSRQHPRTRTRRNINNKQEEQVPLLLRSPIFWWRTLPDSP